MPLFSGPNTKQRCGK